jgi:hypothetical protein
MTNNLELQKKYYYECLHWTIKLCIYQIKKNNYPIDWWNENLKNTLRQKNNYAKKINNNTSNQLLLF